MRALRYKVRIGADHRVTVDVPPEAPQGEAEVIVLFSEQKPAVDDDLGALLEEWRQTSPSRSKEDIDRQVREERESWGE